jgi:hypothetical protein
VKIVYCLGAKVKSNNLLISKKISYSKTKQDIKELTFTYNDEKQYLTARFQELSDAIDKSGHSHQFYYGNILYKNTKLPIITLETTQSYLGSCNKEYAYNLNNENYAKTIQQITTSCSTQLGKTDYIDTFAYYANENIKTIDGKYITYTSFNKINEVTDGKEKDLYVYDKNHLLTSIERYEKKEDTYKLLSTQILKYENKSYYNKHVPNSIDFNLYDVGLSSFIF